MADFKIALKLTLDVEGKFSNSKYDAGGMTNYGITIATARANGYDGEMKDLPLEKAISIYKSEYWDIHKLDNVNSQKIANKIFDSGVNCSPGNAATWCQSSLNTLNRRQTDWNDVVVDGRIGNITVGIINFVTALKKNGVDYEDNLYKCINILQGYHYLGLANNPARQDHMNINGWIKNRITG